MDQEGNRGQLDQPVSETPDEAARIREQIEHTRAHLSGTIEELQERLRPEHLVTQAGDAVRATVEQKVKTMVNTASETASRMAGQARDSAETVTAQLQNHPVPTALALGGLAWWMMRRDRPARTDASRSNATSVLPAIAVGAFGYYLLSQRMLDLAPLGSRGMAPDAYGDALPDEYRPVAGEYREYGAPGGARAAELGARPRDLGETAGEQVRRLGETADQYRQRVQAAVGEYAGQVGDQARHLSETARDHLEETTTMLLERSEELGENFDRWMQENPLTVGVAAFALGAIAGLSFPVSSAEHRTLGAARETLMAQAGQAVDSALSPASS